MSLAADTLLTSTISVDTRKTMRDMHGTVRHMNVQSTGPSIGPYRILGHY